MGILQTVRNRLISAPKAKAAVHTNDHGWLDTSWPSNWFQMDLQPRSGGGGPVVEACISAYAQTVSQLTLRLYKKNDDNGRTHIDTTGDSKYSNIARLLHRPNDFQTKSDFILNMIYQLLGSGNAYYYGSGPAARPDALWLLDTRETAAHRSPDGPIYYSTGGPYTDWVSVPIEAIIPSRYVGHLRLHTPKDPLVGVTPIAAAAMSIAANGALTRQQAAFFENMSRPSGFLSTDMDINAEQMGQLRDAWKAQSTDLNAGGMPILASGMKYQQMSISSQDAQLVEAWRMSIEDISRVLRVPLPLINSMENATLNNAETTFNFWLSSGLGFMLRHIEENFERFFDLGEEYEIEFDTDRLLRADLQGRMAALGDAVTKGIYSPDEARAKEGLAKVEGGHGEMPRVQQQMVPLDFEHEGSEPVAAPAEPAETEAPAGSDEEKKMSDDFAGLLSIETERSLHALVT